MKRPIIVVLILVTIFAFGSTAFAANSLKSGMFGFNVGFDGGPASNGAVESSAIGTYVNNVATITGKVFISNNMAILAGLGFQTDGGDKDASYNSFAVGARYYLKVDDFAPFIDGKLTYAALTVKDAAGVKIADCSIFDLGFGFGAEYFLAKQFSLEGSVGLGFGSASNDAVTPAQDDTYFGTRSLGVSANFYF